MISIAHRFHGHGSLRYVYQHGQTARSPLMTLKYIQNGRRTQYRAAVVVSKKVSKSAVKRNRIRRRLYEQIRTYESQISKPYDLVITVFHEQIAILPAEDLKRLMHAQLRQAGVLSATSTASHVKM